MPILTFEVNVTNGQIIELSSIVDELEIKQLLWKIFGKFTPFDFNSKYILFLVSLYCQNRTLSLSNLKNAFVFAVSRYFRATSTLSCLIALIAKKKISWTWFGCTYCIG